MAAPEASLRIEVAVAVGCSAFSLIAGYLPIFKEEPPPPVADEPWIETMVPDAGA